MSCPDLNDVEIAAVNQVLATRYLSIGPRTADYIGVRHAVGVSSDTARLHLSIIAAAAGEDDLVITAPFSFVASPGRAWTCPGRCAILGGYGD